jgi:ring-1,2-phenylacetyl-CoA epoxidase subunit PaaD
MCGAEVRDRIDAAWAVLGGVLDPEVPALSVCDLGIVREVLIAEDGGLHVVLTPTYSGCPATEVISENVCAALDAAGLGPTRTSLRRAPAWSSDWISAEGRHKLHAYGIAAPGPAGESTVHVIARGVTCPRCNSRQTERLSAFGSTACKAMYRCLACHEPFEHFKPI